MSEKVLRSGKVVKVTIPSGRQLARTPILENTTSQPQVGIIEEPVYANFGDPGEESIHDNPEESGNLGTNLVQLTFVEGHNSDLNKNSEERNILRTPRRVSDEETASNNYLPRRLGFTQERLQLAPLNWSFESADFENLINDSNPFRRNFILSESESDSLSLEGDMAEFDKDEFRADIPVFEGKKSEVDRFCMICDNMHNQLNPRGQQEFYQALPLRLVGEPFELYSKGNFGIWPLFREEIFRRFKKLKSRDTLKRELANTQQGQRTVEEFAKELQSILHQMMEQYAHRRLERGAQEILREEKESEVITAFMDGLNEPLRTNIYSACRGLSLQERMDIAIEEDEKFRTRTRHGITTKQEQRNSEQIAWHNRSNLNKTGIKNYGEPKKEEKPFCDRCRREGHVSKDCRTQYPKRQYDGSSGNNNRIVKCFKCGRDGHITRECQIKLPMEWNRNFVERNTRNMVTCFKCGQKGHYAHNCPPRVESQKKVNFARTYAHLPPKEETPWNKLEQNVQQNPKNYNHGRVPEQNVHLSKEV